ncbi:MAG TPA: FtsX-like permease family protein [Flavobacterium sp.]|nr:FtsX-like permease family protein [Flavobacterium sp.]
MNVAYFIARRLVSDKKYKSSISAPIIKIAVWAVGIGMAMMLISLATGIGLQQKIREKVSAFNGHIIISTFDDNQSEVSVIPISKKQDFYPKFTSVPGIRHIQAVASKAGIIRTETAFEGIIFKGIGPDYDWTYVREYIADGKVPNVKNAVSNEILMSRYLANRLQLKVGDRFNTFFTKTTGNQLPYARNFTVSGIYDSGFQEFDATHILGDIRHVQHMNKWVENEVGAFEVFVDDFDAIAPKAREVYDQTPSTLDTRAITAKYAYIFDWLKLFDFNIVVILGIMILVATINMVVALLVLILERTQMIGILKAMGADNLTVRKVFLYNALHLIVRGLFWGNAVGIGLLLIQKYTGVIKLNPENYYVNEAPVLINWMYVLALNAGTVIVCLVTLLIPSYIITRISPVKAIRFD